MTNIGDAKLCVSSKWALSNYIFNQDRLIKKIMKHEKSEDATFVKTLKFYLLELNNYNIIIKYTTIKN